jgi:hypothetical protein
MGRAFGVLAPRELGRRLDAGKAARSPVLRDTLDLARSEELEIAPSDGRDGRNSHE